MLATLISSCRQCFFQPPAVQQSTLEHPAIAAWHKRAEDYRKLADKDLAAAAEALKKRIACKNSDELSAQIDCGALTGEAIRRTVGFDVFDTQRLAGLVLMHGMIAQMQTGEGKTLSGGPRSCTRLCKDAASMS